MKTILITGATSGIGLEAAQQLGAQGHHLVLIGRDPGKLADSRQLVQNAGAPEVDTLVCDFGSQTSVRKLAAAIQSDYDRIDVLANNAGGYSKERVETEDGIESTFAVNHLGGFLLTELLLEFLVQGAPARVVFTSSVMHYSATMDFDDPTFRRNYSGERAYNRSKLANVLYTRALAQRLSGTALTVNSFHPGAVATHIWDSMPWYGKPLAAIAKQLFMISPAAGARTLTHLAVAPEVAQLSGHYFQHNRIKTPSRRALDDETAQRLCEISAELVGLPDSWRVDTSL
ncbi:SDR family NAD(P)-dependent oxidoreductase [Nocardia huaxiensis]|uniref:SDR family NAD(P)-dependent oxidoreductase n=1 Tax=Nocardia huaxiensis TaxID=2755382 RepID=UPI001E381660|nr:SDR family NAD(P)-dependent oxidoreductase [Nocardia huaxiensis]UFS95905.1 SDR family NAD(P)-dependent oxidoreductase [Nocardia huaxiensis]